MTTIRMLPILLLVLTVVPVPVAMRGPVEASIDAQNPLNQVRVVLAGTAAHSGAEVNLSGNVCPYRCTRRASADGFAR